MLVLMTRAANNSPVEDSKVLIVLGCRVRGYIPSLMLSARVRFAGEYLLAHPNCKAVLSGGQGADEMISEALCMKKLLIDMGVDEKRLFIEDRSKSTYENILFSKQIIEKNGLGSAVTIVTSDFHQLRSQYIAGKLGISATGIKVPTKPSSVPKHYIREFLAIIKETLFLLNK